MEALNSAGLKISMPLAWKETAGGEVSAAEVLWASIFIGIE